MTQLTQASWLSWVLNQLGVTENPPQSNNNPYGRALGEDDVPWCALFGADSFIANGVQLPFWSAGVEEWADEAISHGSQWWQDRNTAPRIGMGAPRSWEGKDAGQANPADCHWQVVVGIRGSAVDVVGGNQNDPSGGIVSRDTFTLGDMTSMGFVKLDQLFTSTPPSGKGKIPVKTPTKSPSHATPMPMLYLGQPDTAQDEHWTKRVQQSLNILGAQQDGVFGAFTQSRVEGYQQQHGLTVDGVVGPKTYASLKISYDS